MFALPLRLPVLGVFVVLALSGCKDGLVTPERFGSIDGRVIDFETREPVAGAGVTTSPATGSVITGDDGSFLIEDVLTGTYTVTASRSGYDTGTTTVSVREGDPRTAIVFLSTDDADGADPDFAAEVLNFTNETFAAASGADSSFVSVEYRATNRGDDAIASYEIYFRIETDQGPFYQEVSSSEGLAAGRQDFGTIRKYVLGGQATNVVIEDTAAERGDS